MRGGARRTIVTSQLDVDPPAARGVRPGRAHITDITVNAAKLCRKLERGWWPPSATVSPSFTGTEPDYGLEVCRRSWTSDDARPADHPEPATVGVRANVYAA
jgi:hypothetical protein